MDDRIHGDWIPAWAAALMVRVENIDVRLSEHRAGSTERMERIERQLESVAHGRPGIPKVNWIVATKFALASVFMLAAAMGLVTWPEAVKSSAAVVGAK